MKFENVLKNPSGYTKLFKEELLKHNYPLREIEGMTLRELYEEVKYSLSRSIHFFRPKKEEELTKVQTPYSTLNPGKGFKVTFSMNGNEHTARFLTREKAESYIDYLSTKNVESISDILSEEELEKY